MKTLLQILFVPAGFVTLFVVIEGITTIFGTYGLIIGWSSIAAIVFFLVNYGAAYQAQQVEDNLRDKLTLVGNALTKTDPK